MLWKRVSRLLTGTVTVTFAFRRKDLSQRRKGAEFLRVKNGDSYLYVSPVLPQTSKFTSFFFITFIAKNL